MKNIVRWLAAIFFVAATVFSISVPAFAAVAVQGVAAGGQYLTLKVDKGGRLVGAYIADNTAWFATASLTDNTLTALHASAGAGLKNCLAWIDISGVAATTAGSIVVKDGASTVKFTFNIPAAASSRHIAFEVPFCGTAATALNVALSGTLTGAVQVNAGGYVAP